MPKGSVKSFAMTTESDRRARKLSDDELARKSGSLFDDKDNLEIPNRQSTSKSTFEFRNSLKVKDDDYQNFEPNYDV